MAERSTSVERKKSNSKLMRYTAESRRNLPQALALLACLLVLGLPSCDEDTIEPVFFGDLYGEVLTADGDIPVEGVTISTNPPTSIVVTDAGGRFVLPGIPEGTYSLRAELDGYATQVASVAVFGDRDANVVIRLENNGSGPAPSAPKLVAPLDDTAVVPLGLRLLWQAGDSDRSSRPTAPGDSLRYDVLLFNSDRSERRVLAVSITDTSFVVEGLQYGTRYFWQVAVDDGRKDPTFGPVWGFTTKPFPDLRIHFARERAGVFDLYATDGRGTELQLTDNEASNWRPRVSPQRDRIAFISNRGVQPQIYVMDRDGRNVRQVTTIPISGADLLDLDFTWSPDGSRIVYPAGSQLLSILPDGSGVRVFAQAPPGFTFAECDFTGQGRGPDGPGAVVARLVGPRAYISRISLYSATGSFERDLVPDGPGSIGGLRISVAGTRVLYTQDASGFEDLTGRQLDARLYEVDLISGAIRDLSHNKVVGTNDLDPVYSPDGGRVLFSNTNNDGVSRLDLFVASALDGTGRTRLVEDALMPEWR